MSEREGRTFWGMLPNCSSNGRRARTHTKARRHEGTEGETTQHAKLSIPIPLYKMAHTLSCRLVSRWLCLGNADTTRHDSPRVLQLHDKGGGDGDGGRGQNCVLCVYFVFHLIYLYNCCFSAFVIFVCFARTFSNFIAYFL